MKSEPEVGGMRMMWPGAAVPAARSLALALLLAAFCLTLCRAASAQTTSSTNTDGRTPAALRPGSPAGSYALSGFESVNPFNGSLNFSLPLLKVGGRGQAGFTMTLPVEQKWRVERDGTPLYVYDEGGGPPLPAPHVSYRYVPRPDWWQGIVNGYGTGVLEGRRAGYGEMTCPDGSTIYYQTLTRLTFTAPDGTEFELRDQKTGGQPAYHGGCGDYMNPSTRGKVFVTADGTSATFLSDQSIADAVVSPAPDELEPPPSGYLMLRDGTRYRVDSGRVSWMRDRDGNLVKFDYDDSSRVKLITDSVGRRVTINYASASGGGQVVGDDVITFAGFGGEQRTLTITRNYLANALRHTQASDPTTTTTYNNLFSDMTQVGTTPYNLPVVTKVTLPNEHSYNFFYNQYGELARVELPTGGAIEYDWAGGIKDGSAAGVVTFSVGESTVANIYRRVVARRVYTDRNSATPEQSMTYSRPESVSGSVLSNAGYVDVQSYDGAGTLLAQERHYYHGAATDSFKLLPTDYGAWDEGREYQTDICAAANCTTGSVLRRVGQQWRQRASVGWWPLPSSIVSNSAGEPPNDPRVVETLTTVEPDGANLVSKRTALDPGDSSGQTVGFDRYNDPTDVWEYDFGATPGAVGPLVRHTRTDYVATNAAGGTTYDYACDPATTCKEENINPDVIHLRGLPLRKYVYDAGGVPRARTDFEYDNYTVDPSNGNRHAKLISYDNIFGLCLKLDQALNCMTPSGADYLTRGNVTGTTGYLLDKDGNAIGSVTSSQQYDVAGNILKAIDARGFETTFDFSDNFGTPDAEARNNTTPPELLTSSVPLSGHALPKSVTNALGQAAYTQYDYYTGQVVNFEDANGTVTSVRYDDQLDRPKQAERAVNVPALHSQTTFSYDDTNRVITAASDLNTLNDNLLKSETVYDGLGRTTESRQYESSTQYIATQTHYDALGRVSQVSNPFRPLAQPAETPVWTSTSYDALSRVLSVTTPDNATVYNFYDGARTMVTDQAGQQRISKSDALGRLTDVWEVTASDAATEAVSFPVPQDFAYVPAAGYRTSYAYDVLGNLRKVVQGGQARYFAYDSLSRLIRARNPEQDAIVGLALPANMLQSPSDNNSWTLADEYDENGKLTKRTDARGIVTNYGYDALGRMTGRTYSDSTPAVNYYYDSQALPPGTPAFNRGKSAGMLVAVTYGGASSTTGSYLGGYDELGRAHYSSQVTIAPDASGQPAAQTYALSYDYYVDGRPKTETYPSNKVVETQYDAAGRVAGVKNQGGSYYAGGDPSVPNNQDVIKYTASGAVSDLKLGNGLWERTTFNTRLQPERLYLGSAAVNNSLLELDYSYGTTDNNGNVRSQTIIAPAVGNNPSVAATQTYSYDSLNRLAAAWEVDGIQEAWRQTYVDDRYGNRRLDEQHTTKLDATGANVPVVDATNHSALNPTISASTNRITEAGYSYDAAGNLLCDPGHGCAQTPSFTPYYAYDAEDKMTGAGGASASGGASYTYDGGGQRVVKMVGSVTTVFVYDAAGKLVAEYSNSQPQVGGASYVTADTLGSTRVVTGQGQEVKGRHDYFPFGEEIGVDNSWRTAVRGYGAGDGVRQRFTSKERDSETGLDYFLARYYSSIQGRFTSPDEPLVDQKQSNPQSWNSYSYVRNSPCNNVDPSGKCSAPSGLKPGSVGICIEAFIAAKSVGVGGFGRGNNRTFSGDDEKLTSKVRVDLTVTYNPKDNNAKVEERTTAGVSVADLPAPVGTIALPGTGSTKIIDVTTDENGTTTFTSTTTAKNGFQDLPLLGRAAPAGTIDIKLNLVVSKNGRVGIAEGSEVKQFPSYGVYSYRYDENGKLITTTIKEIPEHKLEDLTKSMVPIPKADPK